MPNALRQSIDRFGSVRRQYGARTALQQLFDRIAQRLVNLSVIEVVWLNANGIPEALRASSEFQFRFLDADEVAFYASDPSHDLESSLADRIRAGHDLCFAALDGEHLAAYGWYALHCIEPEHCFGVPLSYPDDVAYMYKGFTHQNYRGKRLHGLIMGLALQELRHRGIRSLVSTVDWTNWASLKSCDRLGYARLGKVVSFGLGKLRFQFHPERAKRLGVRFGNDASRRQQIDETVTPCAASC